MVGVVLQKLSKLTRRELALEGSTSPRSSVALLGRFLSQLGPATLKSPSNCFQAPKVFPALSGTSRVGRTLTSPTTLPSTSC